VQHLPKGEAGDEAIIIEEDLRSSKLTEDISE
jgi:hypothetical protein